MNKHVLAKELRERQFTKITIEQLRKTLGRPELTIGEWQQKVYSLSDDDIIGSYNMCSSCQEHFIEDKKLLEKIIKDSKNIEDFFYRLDSVSNALKILHAGEQECQGM